MSEMIFTDFGNETIDSFPTMSAEEAETKLRLLEKSLMEVGPDSFNDDVVNNKELEYATLLTFKNQNPYPEAEQMHPTSIYDPKNITIEELVGVEELGWNEPRDQEVTFPTEDQDYSLSWIDDIIYSFLPSLPLGTVSKPELNLGHPHDFNAGSSSTTLTPTISTQPIKLALPGNNYNLNIVPNAPSNNTQWTEIVANEPRGQEVNSSKYVVQAIPCDISSYTPSPPDKVSEPYGNSGQHYNFLFGDSSNSNSILPKNRKHSSIPKRSLKASICERNKMLEVATSAMGELINLAKTNEPLWLESNLDKRLVLDINRYRKYSGKNNYQNDKRFWADSSKFSGTVMMRARTLVGIFMDLEKWMLYFNTIVADARIIKVLASGKEANLDGSLQLISQYLHVMSPLVPPQRQKLLRYCKKIKEGCWAVVDVSPESTKLKHDNNFITRKHPSGCLIKDMSNGRTKVTWIEHLEIPYEQTTNELFKPNILEGVAFGAKRWVSTLERVNERMEFIPNIFSSNLSHIGEVIYTSKVRQNLMKFSQKMMNDFSNGLSPCNNDTWSTVSKKDDVIVRASSNDDYESDDGDDCRLNAVTSIWIRHPPEKVFIFLRNPSNHYMWDIHCAGTNLEGFSYVVSGTNPLNCVSILEETDVDKNKRMILQENSVDSIGRSFVVYSPIDVDIMNKMMVVDVDIMNRMMAVKYPSGLKILPSGFVVTPTRGINKGSSNMISSIVTIACQTSHKYLRSEKPNSKIINGVKGHLIAISEELKKIFRE